MIVMEELIGGPPTACRKRGDVAMHWFPSFDPDGPCYCGDLLMRSDGTTREAPTNLPTEPAGGERP